MRELKFRAWVYYGDELEKPHYSRDYGSLDRFFEDHSEDDIDQCIEQYTGLKDKNGKEIYEGDVVKIQRTGKRSKIYRVGWFILRAGFIATRLGVKTEEYLMEDFYEIMSGEIIGNIHENPELLEEKG